jgi:hypothetical protein
MADQDDIVAAFGAKLKAARSQVSCRATTSGANFP